MSDQQGDSMLNRFNATGWMASYKVNGFTEYRDVHLNAEGYPSHVFDGNRRVSPNDPEGFEEIHPCHRFVQVLPAEPGWRFKYTHKNMDEEVTIPILAWAVDASGDMHPIPFPQSNGYASPSFRADLSYSVIPPDGYEQ
ncbi:hypothetical protein AB0I28_32485 [Phytomonospora sp. NPDC050363]|uniref:hypothetical protein n=1 Tax=Phytomonospora sp. NPDC050363 TaxID=3155642 RepID=UPI0033E7866A